MKIRAIKINNFLGIDEFNWNPGESVNILEGPKGSGKSSVIEGIEKSFSNIGRRTELIRHGNNEATLYVETNTGLEIDRRIRADKADYLKLRQQGEGIKSTEGQLRKFLSGDIFRPLDFINLDIKEQTKIILNMIEMDYSPEQICNWFGEDVLSGINTDKHLLQILKDIEIKYYKEREEVNREIRSLEAQVKGIEKELPANYDGEEWKNVKIQDYYNKVTEAQNINRYIEAAKALKENFEDRVAAIEAEANNSKSTIVTSYTRKRQEIDDLITLATHRIGKANDQIETIKGDMEASLTDVGHWLEKEIQKLKEQAETKRQEIKADAYIDTEKAREEIQTQKEYISSKQTELEGLGEKQEIEILNVNREAMQNIAHEKERLGKAAEYLEQHEPIDIDPLQQEADRVAEMQSYLREWDRMVEIRDGQLAKKEQYSALLTSVIETARNKPGELLKQHELPIEGISVDEEARIRINETLLDGLSDGEKMEVAFKIALDRMGDLRIICLDGFEKLNESEQKKILELCEKHDIQAFVTVTKDTPDGKFVIKENGGKSDGLHG